MRIRTEYGLQIAEADAEAALAAHRAGRLPPVPILRVPDPPAGHWPVPAARFGPARAGDVADLLLCLDELTDPTLMLGYSDDDELVTDVFTRKSQLDPTRYPTERIRRVRRVTLPA